MASTKYPKDMYKIVCCTFMNDPRDVSYIRTGRVKKADHFGSWVCTNRKCRQHSSLIAHNSPVYSMRRLRYTIQVRIFYHFLFNTNPGRVFKSFGGIKHSPIGYDVISSHLLTLRHVVAAENVQNLQNVFLTGRQEWDETWLRCKRKHNRGRYTDRKFALVTYFCFLFSITACRKAFYPCNNSGAVFRNVYAIECYGKSKGVVLRYLEWLNLLPIIWLHSGFQTALNAP